MTENIFLTSLLFCAITMIFMNVFSYDEIPKLLSLSVFITFVVSLVCVIGSLLTIIWR